MSGSDFCLPLALFLTFTFDVPVLRLCQIRRSIPECLRKLWRRPCTDRVTSIRSRAAIARTATGACAAPDSLSPTRSPTKAFSISSCTGSGRRSDLATTARDAARAPGRVDHRRDQLSQEGTLSVGVGRQLLWRKIANCQVAVTAGLWTGARVADRGAAVSNKRSGSPIAIGARSRRFPRGRPSRRNDVRRSP